MCRSEGGRRSLRESKEKNARIAAVERRLKLNSGNSHQPSSQVWAATPKKSPRRELEDFEQQEGRGAAGTLRDTSKAYKS